jgi:hypothetical protein
MGRSRLFFYFLKLSLVHIYNKRTPESMSAIPIICFRLIGSFNKRLDRARVATRVSGVRINMYFPTSVDSKGIDNRILPSMKRKRLAKMYGEKTNLKIVTGSENDIP